MSKALGVLALAIGAGLLGISLYRKKKEDARIDTVINTYQARESVVVQQKSDVLDPLSMNATNLNLFNSAVVDQSQQQAVNLFSFERID